MSFARTILWSLRLNVENEVERLRKLDLNALDSLIPLYQHRLFRYLLRMAGDKSADPRQHGCHRRKAGLHGTLTLLVDLRGGRDGRYDYSHVQRARFCERGRKSLGYGPRRRLPPPAFARMSPSPQRIWPLGSFLK